MLRAITAGTFLMLVQMSSASGACNFGSNHALQPHGLIGQTWEKLGGEQSALGCPTTGEMNSESPGKVQSYQYGQISWSQGRGNHAILVAQQAGPKSVELFGLASNRLIMIFGSYERTRMASTLTRKM